MTRFLNLAFGRSSNSRTVEQLMNAFFDLPPRVGRKYLNQSMRRSIKPFLPALRAATPVGATGNLRRSAGNRVKQYAHGDWHVAVGVVGFRKGGKDPRKRGNHAGLVERGTRARYRKTQAAGLLRRLLGNRAGYTGRMPAERMLRGTLQSKRSAILGSLTRELAAGLERAAADLARG